MEWKDIAVVSGKPGLYRIFKPTRSGMIVESLDGKKKKLVINSSYRVSILQEISIYTNNDEGSVDLEEIYYRTTEKFGKDYKVKRDSDSLKAFMNDVLPNYDRERVYVSDMKKLATWYEILAQVAPEMLERKEKETTQEENKEEGEK